MLRTVKAFFDKYFPSHGHPYRVLVGLSGGADSVALLLSLRQLGIDGVAAHCNFNLRGDESLRDEEFCRHLCKRLDVSLQVRHFDVGARCRDTGESVEMACRALRYAWWEELLETLSIPLLAVGHHLEDNVETLMLNLMRGSGIRGVKGMLPVSGHIIRPLLEVDRATIERFVKSAGESWIIDSTNLSNDFSRNKLRNIVLPALEEAFPGAIKAMSRTMSHLRDNFTVYDDCVGSVTASIRIDGGGYDLNKLWRTQPHAAEMLFDILSADGFNSRQASGIASSMSASATSTRSGLSFSTVSGNWTLEYGRLLPASDDQQPVCHGPLSSLPLDVSVISRQEFNSLRHSGNLGRSVICLDGKVMDLQGSWTLRPWLKGDRIRPFGMKGSRLVSDIFADAKIGISARRHIALLLYDNEIVWVTGLRASSLFPVTGDSKSIVKIQCL